jgi:hypothetical protein
MIRVSLTATQRGMTPFQMRRFSERLGELNREFGIMVLVHGGCIGGDDEGDIIAALLGINRLVYPGPRGPKRIDDGVFKSRTGSNVTIMPSVDDPLKRNPFIVKAGRDRLFACPRQRGEIIRSGTWTTIRLGRKLLGEDRVEIIYP